MESIVLDISTLCGVDLVRPVLVLEHGREGGY